VIPEIDIWRAANLMMKRYGNKAREERRTRVDELTAAGDHDGADTWRRISAAVVQLANNTPSGLALLFLKTDGARIFSAARL
jgi:hypothetical protein